MKTLAWLITAATLSGCVLNYAGKELREAEELAKQNNWVGSYSALEIDLVHNIDPEKLKSLTTEFPNIISIGMRDIYMARLKVVKESCGRSTFFDYLYHIKNLSYNQYAGDARVKIFDDSKMALNYCASKPESEAWPQHLSEFEKTTGLGYFFPETFTQAAINEAKATKEKEAQAKARTGIIINAQVANESHINNGAGASLGAAYAQANYIDNTRWQNYSASKQLGAGLVGALIGAALLDKPTTPSFQTTYFVKLLSGDIKQVEVTSNTATHLPEGACVEADDHNLTMVNQGNCASIPANK